MADSRRISIYINDEEITGSLQNITSETNKLRRVLKTGLIPDMEEYNEVVKKIQENEKILKDQRAAARGVALSWKEMKKNLEETKGKEKVLVDIETEARNLQWLINNKLVPGSKDYNEAIEALGSRKRILKEHQDKLKEISTAYDNIKKKPTFLNRLKEGFGEVTKSLNPISGLTAAAFGAVAVGTIIKTGKQIIELAKEYKTLRGEIKQLTDLTGGELNKATVRTRALTQTFGENQKDLLLSANTLSKEFNISIDESLALIEKGLLAGANVNGEFLEQIKEYPTQFAAAGGSAEQFVAHLANATKEGIFTDKGADVVKEFSIRIKDQTTATTNALEDAFGEKFTKNIFKKINDGSLTVIDSLKIISKEMDTTQLSSKQLQTVVTNVFGGAGEDAGERYLKSLYKIEDGVENLIDETNSLTKSQIENLKTQKELAEAENELSLEIENLTNGQSNLINKVKTFAIEILIDLIRNTKIMINWASSAYKVIKEWALSTTLLGGKLEILGYLIRKNIEGWKMFFRGLRNTPQVLIGVTAAFKQMGENIAKYFQGIKLEAEILFLSVKSLYDKQAKLKLNLKKMKLNALKDGKTVGEAFKTAYNKAVQEKNKNFDNEPQQEQERLKRVEKEQEQERLKRVEKEKKQERLKRAEKEKEKERLKKEQEEQEQERLKRAEKEKERLAKIEKLNEKIKKTKEIKENNDSEKKEKETIQVKYKGLIDEAKALKEIEKVKELEELKQNEIDKIQEKFRLKREEEKEKETIQVKYKGLIDEAEALKQIEKVKELEELKQNEIDEIQEKFRLKRIEKEQEEIDKEQEEINKEIELATIDTLQDELIELQEHYDKIKALAEKHGIETTAITAKYEREKELIEEKFREKGLQRYELLFNNIGNAFSKFIQIFNNESQGAIVFQKGIALAQIGFDTAKAISGVIATAASTSLTPIDMAIKIATGISAVIANIAQAKNIISETKVPQKYKGGFTDVIGADDNKKYHAENIGSLYETGLLDPGPKLILANEEGAEYFVDANTVKKPEAFDHIAALEVIAGRTAPNKSIRQMKTGGLTKEFQTDSNLDQNIKPLDSEILNTLENINNLLSNPPAPKLRLTNDTLFDIRNRIKQIEQDIE